MNDLFARNAGLGDGIPGHYLSVVPAKYVSDNKHFTCTCGATFYAKMKKDGNADARAMRTYNDHLAGVSAPEEFIPLGTVKLKRLTHEYVVFPSTYSGADKYNPSNSYWTLDRAKTNGWWLVGIRKSNGQYTAVIGQPSRKKAIAKALFILNREKDKGLEVTFYDETNSNDVVAPAFSPQTTFALLLDEVDACMAGKDLAQYLEVQEHLDDALALVPMLEAKRTQFLAKRVEVFGR